MQSIENIAVGTRVRVTFEGTVEAYYIDGRMRKTVVLSEPAPGRMGNRLVHSLALAKEITTLAPVWQPGDVVVVRFHPQGEPYTYVRGARVWPGERANNKSDAEIDALFEQGKAEHVLRGGKPVEKVSESDAALTELRERLSAPAPTASDFYGTRLRVGDSVTVRRVGVRGTVQRITSEGVEVRPTGASRRRTVNGTDVVRGSINPL